VVELGTVKAKLPATDIWNAFAGLEEILPDNELIDELGRSTSL